MYPKKQVMYAPDAQDVCDGVNYAERPSPRTYIPACTDVATSHEGSDSTVREKHGLTRAGRKIDAVNGRKNAPLRSSQFVATPKTSIDKQTYIDRLPNEILCAIFLICGDPSPASIFPRDYDMHTYDMEAHRVKPYSKSVALLGRVCAHWYAVTRGSPTLWTVVDVAYPTREATSVLKLCLKHSAGLPLSLWISNSLRPDARAKGVDPHFMALVAANASRWTELSIELRDEVFVLQTLTTLPSGAFSSLRRARIKFYERKTQESNADTLLLKQFFTSPSLDCVDLTRTGYIETGLAFAPLHQLTSLGMHRAKPDMVSTVLRNCTSLELLYIRIEPFAFGRAGNVPLSIPFPSCLPRLRVLFLCGPIDWTPLWTSLTVPALDRLDISHTDIPHTQIERMLVRSSSRMRMLAINCPELGQTDGALALIRSTTLRGLRILRYNISYPGASMLGWEDTFDIRPFIPPQVVFAADAVEAEQLYIKLCKGAL